MEFKFLDFNVIKGDEIDLHLTKTVPGNKDKKWVPAYHFNISLSGSSKHWKNDSRKGIIIWSL